MNSYNPFSMLMNMMNNQRNPQQMFPISRINQPQQRLPINQEQFRSFLPKINNKVLEQLIQQARSQGISDEDIQAGINFLNQLR